MAIQLISEHVKRQLAQRAASFLREKMGRSQAALRKHPSPLPSPKIREALLESNVILMEQTTQLQGIYTILRNKSSTRVDFIFYADRLATLVCERSMCELPFRPKTITCPTTEVVDGKELDAQVSVVLLTDLYEGRPLSLCGRFCSCRPCSTWSECPSFDRGCSNMKKRTISHRAVCSGGAFERGLRRVLRDVALGSLLIQSDPKSGEPLLLHTMVPDAVRDRNKAVNTWVLVLDAQVRGPRLNL